MTNDYGTEAVAVHHDSHSKTYHATKQRRSAPCRAACAEADVCGTTKRTAKGRRAAPRKSVVRIPERHRFIHVNTHSKGVGVSLLVAETTGALAASFMTILRLLARQTRLPGATDNTRYGEGRASPRSFLTHHVANISTAIQAADAQTISTPPARACSASHLGSCKVCVF